MATLNNNFIGWIPCVSGTLRYTYASCGLGLYDRLTFNHSFGDCERNILITSIVNWQDDEIPREDGLFRVILYGDTALDNNTFSGQCIILPLLIEKDNFQISINKQEFAWTRVLTEIDILCTKYRKYLISHGSTTLKVTIDSKNASDAEIHLKILFDAVRSKLDNCIAATAIQSNNDTWKNIFRVIDFRVERDGFTFLTNRHLNKTNTNDIDQNQEDLHLCRQVFYYLRESLHKHQHHDINNDSLTSIHRAPVYQPEICEKIIDELKRGLTDIRRSMEEFNLMDLQNAEGIISYARSFLTSCKIRNYVGERAYQIHDEYLKNLACSFNTLSKDWAHKNQKLNSHEDRIRSLILLVLAIFSPVIIIGLHASGTTSSPFASFIIYFFSSSIGAVVCTLTILYFYIRIINKNPKPPFLYQPLSNLSDFLSRTLTRNCSPTLLFIHKSIINLFQVHARLVSRSAWSTISYYAFSILILIISSFYILYFVQKFKIFS